ncbi:MAG: hypothetical protein ACI8W7_000068 [Gammaproteobacteria bacterium]|jgi:hypothetical protein
MCVEKDARVGAQRAVDASMGIRGHAAEIGKGARPPVANDCEGCNPYDFNS